MVRSIKDQIKENKLSDIAKLSLKQPPVGNGLAKIPLPILARLNQVPRDDTDCLLESITPYWTLHRCPDADSAITILFYKRLQEQSLTICIDSITKTFFEYTSSRILFYAGVSNRRNF